MYKNKDLKIFSYSESKWRDLDLITQGNWLHSASQVCFSAFKKQPNIKQELSFLTLGNPKKGLTENKERNKFMNNNLNEWNNKILREDSIH